MFLIDCKQGLAFVSIIESIAGSIVESIPLVFSCKSHGSG